MANDLEFGPTACRVSNESAVRAYDPLLYNVSAEEFCFEDGRYSIFRNKDPDNFLEYSLSHLHHFTFLAVIEPE